MNSLQTGFVAVKPDASVTVMGPTQPATSNGTDNTVVLPREQDPTGSACQIASSAGT